ncbi:uncharacterized protein KD926_005627 [Aspergillus affinis]|uniref:uncharacterized protein n=1 Tax=Aspergillus affinis TaxID=1070780 RepID=UPI0022FF0EB2|nr:uncharacterized protein KD926_005627 [Aspergillus affinis]KAI9042332.1 hypothetical protein KD926_005627 [Aspergillus affinis]
MGQASLPAVSRSRLECLPAEIIQEIFLHSLEFNFPRVSRYIAGILSNTVIYTWLIRLAFSSANEGSKRGLFTPDFLPAPLDFWALSTEERRDLQTDILACGWCTLPLIQKCQRQYVEQVIRRQMQDLEFCADDLPALAEMGRRFESLEGYEKDERLHGKGDMVLKAHDRTTEKEARVAVWFHHGTVQILQPSRLYTRHDIFQLPDCSAVCPPRMPDKLLCPPWTESKLEFLHLLSTTAYIDEDSSLSRSKRVLRQLIRDRDLATFERLMQMQVMAQDYKYPQRWPVPTIIFRAALKYADERDDPFVRVLVNHCWEDIPGDDLQLRDQLMTKAGLNSVG